LAVTFESNGPEDPSGTVELVFSGGGTLRLNVECLDSTLSDVSADWAARHRPNHPLET